MSKNKYSKEVKKTIDSSLIKDSEGNCTNVSPAITLNNNGNFVCWSKQKVN